MNAIQTLVLAAPLCLVLMAASGCGAAATPADSALPPQETTKPVDTGTSDMATKDPSPGETGDGATDASPDKNKTDKGMSSRGVEVPVEGAPPPPPLGGASAGPQQASAAMSGAPLSSGRLSQKDIGDILSRNAALFNDCYTIGASGGQSFTGTVTVKATLGPTGNVADVKVTKSTAKNQKVDQCVAAAFKKIKFPAPSDGATSVITFPMEFNGVEQVR